MSFNAPGTHLQNLILDNNASNDEKLACLKTLRIILKNLTDPIKSTDPKYKSIKASKISAKFAPCPSATEYLKAIGFATIVEDGEDVFRIENVDISAMEAVMIELSNALEMITPTTLGDRAGEEKKVEYERGSSSISTTSTTTGRISEKQKARMLLEKKEREEKEKAKRARKQTEAQIKQDKFVRENDENWTSKQSAACVKSGDGISTFRDKYGE